MSSGEFNDEFSQYPEPIASMLRSQREASERHYTEQEMFRAAFTNLLTCDLDVEQLETLHGVFAAIANAGTPRSVANWYEGITAGVLLMRKPITAEQFDGSS